MHTVQVAAQNVRAWWLPYGYDGYKGRYSIRCDVWFFKSKYKLSDQSNNWLCHHIISILHTSCRTPRLKPRSLPQQRKTAQPPPTTIPLAVAMHKPATIPNRATTPQQRVPLKLQPALPALMGFGRAFKVTLRRLARMKPGLSMTICRTRARRKLDVLVLIVFPGLNKAEGTGNSN